MNTRGTEPVDRWKQLPPRIEATATSADVEPVVPGPISRAPDRQRDAMPLAGLRGPHALGRVNADSLRTGAAS